MRTTLKIVLPLAISVLCVSLLYSFYQIQTERRNLRNDLIRRAATLAESLQDSIESANGQTTNRNVQRIVARFGEREHLQGLAVYDKSGSVVAITPGLPTYFNRSLLLRCEQAKAIRA